MSRKAAVVIAGGITTIMMVLVLGLGGFTSWFNRPTSAASTSDPQGTPAAAVCANPSDVAALQSELKDYQAALQQANTQLQAAYDEISRLQAQRRFGGENEQNDHEGGFFFPFGGD